jgi:hypothetical protein
VSRPPNRRVTSRRASGAFIPGARSDPTPRRRPSHRATSGRHASRPCRPSARSRGLTRPSADCCAVVRAAGAALSPQRGHRAALPWSAALPAVPRRRIDQAPPQGGWRAVRWRARSPRRSHTSSPVRVPRPARAFHAAFSPHLTGTPVRFPGPAAPRTPGQGTCTPEHDRRHGTHAPGELRPTRENARITRKSLRCGPSAPLADCVKTRFFRNEPE